MVLVGTLISAEPARPPWQRNPGYEHKTFCISTTNCASDNLTVQSSRKVPCNWRERESERYTHTLVIISGMNFWPPNPGSTVMTSTMSTGSALSTCSHWFSYVKVVLMFVSGNLPTESDMESDQHPKEKNLKYCEIHENIQLPHKLKKDHPSKT
jgi:hypothetical protein